MTESDSTKEALAEYQSLREEISRRSTVQQALFALNLTATVGVFAGVGRGGVGGEDDFRLLALLPFLSLALTILWLDHHGSIHGLGTYIREHIEPGRAMGWEGDHHHRPDRWHHFTPGTYFFAQGLVFAGSSLAAIIGMGVAGHLSLGRVAILLAAAAALGLTLDMWIAAGRTKDGQLSQPWAFEWINARWSRLRPRDDGP